MKTLFGAVALSLCLLVPALPALAADQPAGASEADQAAELQKMQEQLKKMQQQMDQIHGTKDPAARHKLAQQHWQSMMQGMQTMHRCCGGPMMGEMGKGGPGGMHGHMMASPEMMQNRLDMMQLMMDQMLEHQQLLQQPK
jgi:hypothetical protein